MFEMLAFPYLIPCPPDQHVSSFQGLLFVISTDVISKDVFSTDGISIAVISKDVISRDVISTDELIF